MEKKFNIDKIVFIGRSYDEYMKMFNFLNNTNNTNSLLYEEETSNYIVLIENIKKNLSAIKATENTPIDDILNKYQMNDDLNYITIEKMLKEVNSIGYTFEYYLDCIPYNLQKTF